MAGPEDKDNNVQVDVPDFLNMSDEDMATFDPNTLTASGGATTVDADANKDKGGQDDGQVTESAEEAAATAAAAAALESDDDDENKNGKAGDGKGTGDDSNNDGKGAETATADEVARAAAAAGADDKAGKGKEGTDSTTQDDADKAAKDGKDGTTKADDGANKDAPIDYKAAYEQLMAPFKANGRDITPKSPEDAISLMQMGANYNKKMAGLKPSLKLVKMLEANDLMDEGKLGFLIDLHKRDPAAINKLIVDSKMDPLDLSTAKAEEYKPGSHAVDEREMELDEVLEDLKGSKNYNRTLEVVSAQWDKTSKGVITANPQILRIINGHMDNGVYDVIQAEIESERTFGRLKGVSDLDAYKQVGDALQASGGFNHLNLGSSQAPGKPAAAAPVIVQPKPKQDDDDALKDKKRAASGTKAVAPSKGLPADFNPLALSDEDFKKFK
jgi:hypothetical protein